MMAAMASPGMMLAQGVDAQMLLHPPADSWPGYHGDYSGRRHSALTQITPQNVKNLSLAWAFQTDQPAQIKSSPLLVDGILYFTVPDNIWAVDARSGHQIWHYNHPTGQGRAHRASRRGDVQGVSLFFVSRCAPGIAQCKRRNGALERDGRRRRQGLLDHAWRRSSWETTCSSAFPEIFDNLTGYIRSIDPETGETQWQWNRTPPAGTPHQTTGGMTWMTGTYDPDLNLVYWGTGNPTPVLNGSTRPGDDLYTCTHRGAQSGYRQAGVGLPGFAARHARLGCGARLRCWSTAISTASRRRC